jgi:uncharacterized protein YndB with AHSA1/START domain
MKRSDYRPGPPGDVSVRGADDRWTLVFVRQLRQAPPIVWKALTDPAQLREWAPFDADRDLGAPGKAALAMDDGGTATTFDSQVVRAEPPSVLEYTWGEDLLRWELEPAGGGTRLTLRHTVGDRSWLSKVTAGWHICVDVLGHFLDGTPIGRIVGDDAKNHGWEALEAAYAARLGSAAT